MTQALTGQRTTTTTPTTGKAKASDVQAKASGEKAKENGKATDHSHLRHGFPDGDLVVAKAAESKATVTDVMAAKASGAKARAKDSAVGIRTLTPRSTPSFS